MNEGYSGSCLDIAEDLANQTPVRLDVLLSLSPPSVTADQLVVPSGDDPKSNVPRSHSVGSIREIGNTEAERRILDMVAGKFWINTDNIRLITSCILYNSWG